MKMKGNIMLFIFLILGLIILVIRAHTSFEENPIFNYSISGCENKIMIKTEDLRASDEKYGNLTVTVKNSKILIHHELPYFCCANLKLDWKMEDNLINVTEINEGEICRCICNYVVDGSIGPLRSGTYILRVYGVKYKNLTPKILFEGDVKV